jgi:4-diphosphocytidyl-2-C-methyl-D-erythritol kinase
VIRLRELAPAKVNLCLFLGPLRGDGRHELVTLLESVSLCDELSLTTLPTGAGDEVICPGLEGRNLVADALAALRAAGWGAPPVRIEIRKQIPVAAGMGGGSSDAAAALRLADALEPLPDGLAARIARELGADVPSQLSPGVSLGTGAGEIVQPLEPLEEHAFVIVPQPFGLPTAKVYAEADRLGLARPSLDGLRESVLAAVPRPPGELLVNDLQAAALSLAPALGETLEAVRRAGADHALVCGSGPTVIGVLWGADSAGRALRTASSLDRAQVAIPSSASGTMEPDR